MTWYTLRKLCVLIIAHVYVYINSYEYINDACYVVRDTRHETRDTRHETRDTRCVLHYVMSYIVRSMPLV